MRLSSATKIWINYLAGIKRVVFHRSSYQRTLEQLENITVPKLWNWTPSLSVMMLSGEDTFNFCWWWPWSYLWGGWCTLYRSKFKAPLLITLSPYRPARVSLAVLADRGQRIANPSRLRCSIPTSRSRNQCRDDRTWWPRQSSDWRSLESWRRSHVRKSTSIEPCGFHGRPHSWSSDEIDQTR